MLAERIVEEPEDDDEWVDVFANLPAEIRAEVRGLGTVISKTIVQFLENVHILYVDACHSRAKWVILVACFLDGNHHIQPVGFYICPSERKSYWTVFLHMIKLAGVTQERAPDLVVFSDQDKGLEEAVGTVFPWCEHTPCAVHRERHFQEVWHDAHGKLTIDKVDALRALNQMVICYRKACISVTREECEEWLNKAGMLERNYTAKHSPERVEAMSLCNW